MSETKYTPGPWELASGSPYRVMSATVEKGGIVEFGAYICDTANNKQTRTPENAANARLISAAPELVEALLLALEDATGERGQVELTLDWMGKARAALQKAGVL